MIEPVTSPALLSSPQKIPRPYVYIVAITIISLLIAQDDSTSLGIFSGSSTNQIVLFKFRAYFDQSTNNGNDIVKKACTKQKGFMPSKSDFFNNSHPLTIINDKIEIEWNTVPIMMCKIAYCNFTTNNKY